MRKTVLTLATLALTSLLAAGCMSHKMMMSDHSMMSSDGTMMMMNSDGTSRTMTDQEMKDHMTMMTNDPRYASMMADRCKSMSTSGNGTSMSGNSSMASGSMSGSSSMASGSMSGNSSMASGSMSGSTMPSGSGMMVMNSDGTSRPMTDAEMRTQMDMMAKNPQMSQMMTTKCSGM